MGLGRWFPGRLTVQRVLLNSAWLAADNLFRLGVSFFVGAWVARHLGPDQFGLLNYAIAFCAPFSALVGLGLNGILVRELVREPDAAGELLGSAALLKTAAGFVSLALCLAALIAAPDLDPRIRWLVLVTIISTAVQSVDVFDLWFQSQGQARMAAWVRSGASLAMNVGRVVMIASDASLIWFAAVGGLELMLCGAGWAFVGRRSGLMARWRVSGRRCLLLIRESWMVAVAGIAMQIQAYFDQVLLASMRDAGEVGQYAAALRLVSVFAFIPMALSSAASPEITRAFLDDQSRYMQRLCHLYRAMIVGFVAVWIPLALLAGPIVHLLYGERYLLAAALLPVLAGRLLLTNLGVVRGIYLTNERLNWHGTWTAIVGAAVNLVLNVFMIPRWGAMGCGVAALISFGINTVVLEAVHARGRINLRLMFAGMGLPVFPGRRA